MIPFNLEEYLKNPKMKVVTKDGRSVRIICTDKESDFPIVALIKCQDGKELVFSFTKEGEYFPGTSDNKDLFFETKKHEGWVNIYEYGRGKYITSEIVYTKKEDAIMGKNKNYLTTIKIEWEE